MKKLFLILLIFVSPLMGQELPLFKVRQAEIKSLKPKQASKMRIALALFAEVMNNKEFQKDLLALERINEPNAVIPAAEKNKKYKVAKADRNYQLTTRQIIDRIYSGKEFFDSEEADNEADIFWHIRKESYCTGIWLVNRKCGIRGSTPHVFSNPVKTSDNAIFTNSWFIDEIVSGKQDMQDLTEHIGHEWTHKFSFLDTGDEVEKGKFELFPYIFGNLVFKYADQICRNSPAKCKES